jgi:NADPH:quinone reductase-like Zn-dependent oxidoreductase
MALLAGGGYAEEAVVDAGSAMHVPEIFSDVEAGCFPEVFLTAFSNIFLLGEPPPGGAILVHGGGSGVGTAAITLCREAGLRVLVTAGSPEKCSRCLAHGADAAIDYRSVDFSSAVLEATGGRGVDVILDCVGGRYLARNLSCLALGGRLVVIGLIGGARAELDLALLLTRRLRVFGSTLRTRPLSEKAQIVTQFERKFGEALRSGRIRPVIDKVYRFEEVAAAHRRMQSGLHFGKIALVP